MAATNTAAWQEVEPDHWRKVVDGREVMGVGLIAPGRYGWWAYRHPDVELGRIDGGSAETREDAMRACELAVRL